MKFVATDDESDDEEISCAEMYMEDIQYFRQLEADESEEAKRKLESYLGFVDWCRAHDLPPKAYR